MGTLYFVYKTWIESLLPQKKRTGERTKKTAVVAKDAVIVDVADGSAVATGVQSGKATYDESWIPDHHINRPAAKRVQSTGKKAKVVS